MPDRTAVLVIVDSAQHIVYPVQERTLYDDWSRMPICFRLRPHIPTFDNRELCKNLRLELGSLIERGAGRFD